LALINLTPFFTLCLLASLITFTPMGPLIATLIVLAVVILLLIILVGWVIGIYNGLVALRNQIESAWAQIDVQLKRRYDLIPNLVETVKGYAKHESETLEKVIKARQIAIDASPVVDQAQAENQLTSTLRSIMALSESYPDLKANTNFLILQEELTSTEAKIAYSRQFYNDSVMQFQTKKQMFPSNIVANFFNFTNKECFEMQDSAQREQVKVQF